MVLLVKTFEFTYSKVGKLTGIMPTREEWLISDGMPYRLMIK